MTVNEMFIWLLLFEYIVHNIFTIIMAVYTCLIHGTVNQTDQVIINNYYEYLTIRD